MTAYTISTKGTCLPKDPVTLLAYKIVQKEANRFQDAANRKLLICDGKIGKDTIAAVNGVGSMFPTTGVLGRPVVNCREIADKPAAYATALKAIADQNKLAVIACPPESIIHRITNPQPKIGPSGQLVFPDLATAGLGGVPYWLIALIGGGSYYYFYMSKDKKKKSKPRKSLTGGF